MPTSPADDFALIERLYQRVEDDDCYTSLLSELTGPLQAPRGHVFIVDEGGRVAESQTWNIEQEEELREPYHQRHQHKDPRFLASIASPGRVFSDLEVVDASTFERSDLYNEIMVPQDSRYTMFVTARLGDGAMMATAYMRPSTQEAFDRADLARFERLLPHLRRAARLRRLLSSMRDQLADLRAALDAAPVALAVLDDSCRVICANARGQDLLSGRHGIRIVQGRIVGSAPGATAKIMAAVATSVVQTHATARRTDASRDPPDVVTVSRPVGNPLALLFFPLHASHTIRARLASHARALVVFHDPDAVVRVSPELVERVFGLTPTEAQLAAALAEGKSVSDFARDRGCSEQTARTHLKRVLDKTGTHRQPDLVRVILGTVVMRPGTAG